VPPAQQKTAARAPAPNKASDKSGAKDADKRVQGKAAKTSPAFPGEPRDRLRD
jgi:hypothetical protein